MPLFRSAACVLLALAVCRGDGPGSDDPRYSRRATFKLTVGEGIARGTVNAIAFAPDGQALAAGGARHKAGQVRLWNMRTEQEELQQADLPLPVQALAFSPDGKLLAIGEGDYGKVGTVTVVSRDTGKVSSTFVDDQGGPAWTFGLAYSPDGKHLAQSSSHWTTDRPAQGWTHGELRLWDLDSGKFERLSSWDDGSYRGLAFSPDGSTIAIGAGICYLGKKDAGEVRVIDVKSGRVLNSLRGHAQIVESVAYSPDGKLLASGGMDGFVRVWDTPTGRELESFEPTRKSRRARRVMSLGFSPDGKALALAAGSWNRGNRFGELHLWDVPSRTAQGVVLSGLRNPITCVAFSPNGSFVAAGVADGTVEVWKVGP